MAQSGPSLERRFEPTLVPSAAREPLLTSIGQLVALSGARIFTAPFRERGAAFEILEGGDGAFRARVHALLAEHSALAGQFHVLSRDRWRFLLSPSRDAIVPFHERKFALVAWRDPIGPGEARAPALRHFRAYAESRGKHAIVLGASGALTADATSRGFGSVWVGSEPFFALERFSLRGKAGEKLRLAMNHMRRVGGAARELFPRESARDREAMARVEASWKSARAARNNPSFLRTEPMENAAHRRYFAVETQSPAGPRMQSFLVCSPVSRRGFYLQDLVRDPSAPRGATEMVTVAAMEQLRAENVEFATMGIVPLYDPSGARQSSWGSPAVRWCIEHFDKLYRFSGLKQFRSKFAPTWAEPAYVLHWPKVLTPMAVWNIASVLGGS